MTKDVNCDYRYASVVQRLRGSLAENPPREATAADMKELRSLLNEALPNFYEALNGDGHTLRPVEYDICVLIRVGFSPSEISRLTGRSDSYIANTRKRIFKKMYGRKGHPSDLDAAILRL